MKIKNVHRQKIKIQMRMWFKKKNETYPLTTKLDHVMGKKDDGEHREE